MSEFLAAAAEKLGAPEELVERSARARATAQGVDVDSILSAWAGGAAAPAPAATPPPTPEPTPEPAGAEPTPADDGPPDATPAPTPAPVAPCRVLVQRGLVHPSWEDDGLLGLFFAGYRGVDALTAPAAHGPGRWDVAVSVDCVGGPDPTARFPGVDERFEAVRSGMEAKATVEGNGCTRVFYAR